MSPEFASQSDLSELSNDENSTSTSQPSEHGDVNVESPDEEGSIAAQRTTESDDGSDFTENPLKGRQAFIIRTGTIPFTMVPVSLCCKFLLPYFPWIWGSTYLWLP